MYNSDEKTSSLLIYQDHWAKSYIKKCAFSQACS